MAVGGQVLKTGISRRSYSRQAGIVFLAHPAIRLWDVAEMPFGNIN